MSYLSVVGDVHKSVQYLEVQSDQKHNRHVGDTQILDSRKLGGAFTLETLATAIYGAHLSYLDDLLERGATLQAISRNTGRESTIRPTDLKRWLSYDVSGPSNRKEFAAPATNEILLLPWESGSSDLPSEYQHLKPLLPRLKEMADPNWHSSNFGSNQNDSDLISIALATRQMNEGIAIDYLKQFRSSSARRLVRNRIKEFLSILPTDAFQCSEVTKLKTGTAKGYLRATSDLGIVQPELDSSNQIHFRQAVHLKKREVILADLSWFGFGSRESIPEYLCMTPKQVQSAFWIIKCKNRAFKQDTPATSISANLEQLLKSVKHNAILVVSSDDLRAHGAFISNEVSWERTIQSTLAALNSDCLSKTALKPLMSAHRVVITFSTDALLYLRRDMDGQHWEAACFHFVPESIEGDHIRATSGRMRGFDSCVSAALAHHVMLHKRLDAKIDTSSLSSKAAADAINPIFFQKTFEEAINVGLTLGLKAARFLQLHGYDEVKAAEQPDEHIATGYDALMRDPLSHPRQRRYWITPFDLLGTIISQGTLNVWMHPVRSHNEQKDEKRRELAHRLATEWQDCGWVHQHSLDSVALAGISSVRKDVTEDAAAKYPQFDRTWWTLLGNLLNDPTQFGEFGSADDASAAICESNKRALELALNLLRQDMDWLTSTTVSGCKIREKFALDFGSGRDFARNEDEHEAYLSTFWHRGSRLFKQLPVGGVGSFRTIDRREGESLRNLRATIRDYLDSRETRPLNIAVFGPAGAGKSTSVNEIRKDLAGDLPLSELTFNVSQFDNARLLIQAMNEVQDRGLRGEIPFVFWDEYDSAGPKGMALEWLQSFLGPMNDGIYFEGERTRRLPKCVFIFAGSTFSEYAEMAYLNESAFSGSGAGRFGTYSIADWRMAKGPDFKSRLVGALDVLGVNPRKQKEPIRSLPAERYGYLFRRVNVLRFSLKQRWPRLFDKMRLNIDDAVASAFLNTSVYIHDSRSIQKIVQASNVGEKRVYDATCLPPASVLRMHVREVDFERFYLRLV